MAGHRRGRWAWACKPSTPSSSSSPESSPASSSRRRAAILKSRLVLGRDRLALLIFLPNFLWLAAPRLHLLPFLQHIHTRDVGQGRAEGFLRRPVPSLHQSLCRAALAIAGLVSFCAAAATACSPGCISSRFAPLLDRQGPLLLHCRRISHAAWPWALSLGERWLSSVPRWGRIAVEAVFFTGLSACGAYYLRGDPSHRIQSARFAISPSNTMATCARRSAGTSSSVPSPAFAIPCRLTSRPISASPPRNYGEYGAIEILGRAYGLPSPSAPPTPNGFAATPPRSPPRSSCSASPPEQANTIFTGCRLAGHNGNSDGIRERRKPVPPRHLRLRPSAPALARALEGPP